MYTTNVQNFYARTATNVTVEWRWTGNFILPPHAFPALRSPFHKFILGLPVISNMRFLLLALLLVGCSAYYSGQNYSLVLVGGGLYDNNTAIWDTIVALGGGKGVARFGVVSAASEVFSSNTNIIILFYN